MAALKEILAPVKSSDTIFCDHSSDLWLYNTTPERFKCLPSQPQDFGNAHSCPKSLPVTVDDLGGKLTFDAQNENAKKIVYSQHRDLIPKILKDDEEQSQVSKFIKYKPSQHSASFNSGALERIIRMVEMPVDPLVPPKFKHKCVPKANGLPPVPVMHSPPRPLSVDDQKDWKIPPCISNWKNPKGYTIPLDKRLAADGRGLQEVQINDHFAQLSEALYVAEQQARVAVSVRSKVQKEMMMKEKERKEQELRALAQKARSERTSTGPTVGASLGSGSGMVDAVEPMRPEHYRDWDSPRETEEESEERIQREKIREERRRERRLEAKDAAMGKKRKITRDGDRDISEKVALGMASAGSDHGGEVVYDQRLFNQEKGMDSGFATDQYNAYDTGLFTTQPTLSTLYRPKKDADDGGADEQLEKIRKTDRFKPDKEFTGAGPFELEWEVGDPFGLDQFITQVKGSA